MYHLLMKTIIAIVFTSATLVSAQQNDSNNISADEIAVKSVVNKFLIASGNYDADAIPALFTANANIGGGSLKNGKWKPFTMTLEEYLTFLKSSTDPIKYTEPVSKFTVIIEKGKLAFVKADATLLIDGKAKSNNVDYFTLLKENGVWKILSGSYVLVPINK